MARKNSIFSNKTPYKSSYYGGGYKSWSGKTAHKKIKELMDELGDSDKQKVRNYLEDMGENYERPDKWVMYKVVRDIGQGKPVDEVLGASSVQPTITDFPLSPF